MKTFDNLDDLKKYMKNNMAKLTTTKGANHTIHRIMREEAQKLERSLIEVIDEANLTQTMMDFGKRDIDLSAYVYLKHFEIDKDGNIFIEIGFEEGSVTHISVFDRKSGRPKGRNRNPGYYPILADQGWKVTKPTWFTHLKNFGYFDGANFIKTAVERFKTRSDFDFDITIEMRHNGVEITNFNDPWYKNYVIGANNP